MTVDRDSLQDALRVVEPSISIYDLAKQFNLHVDDLLLFIRDNVLPEYQQVYNENCMSIPFWNAEKIQEFFQQQIIDLGFLCQHKIKEINEQMKKKLDTFAHQTFYNNWVMYRGY
jgi:hypothetical protein